MLKIRKSTDRGHLNHGWLDTFHTFSFADYFDPAWTSFGHLRVMNEDVLDPGRGFGMHGHKDMEILTYVLSGALEHQDSLGNGEILRPGEFQRMTAGSGIRHSEFNPSTTEPVHLYQIWLLPKEKGLAPSYEQKPIDLEGRKNQLVLVASPDGGEGSLTIQQNAHVFLSKFDAERSLTIPLEPLHHYWLQVIEGELKINNQQFLAGDGIAMVNEEVLELKSRLPSQILFFNMDA